MTSFSSGSSGSPSVPPERAASELSLGLFPDLDALVPPVVPTGVVGAATVAAPSALDALLPASPASAARDAASCDAAVEMLEGTGDFRVLRRLDFCPSLGAGASAETARGLFIDTETTGFEADRDRMIQMAAVPFDYEPSTGRVVAMHEAIIGLDDPGIPIPPEIVELTGITDAMVRGQHFDVDRFNELAAISTLVIAHNATFDRPFTERRFPAFTARPWGCSYRDIAWKAAGFRSSALEYLAAMHARGFYEAHRADMDCYAAVHVLARPFPNGQFPLSQLLGSCQGAVQRCWAFGKTYDFKDALKTRGYRWYGGETGRAKGWFRDVPAAEADGEMVWLASIGCVGQAQAVRGVTITSLDRYSIRAIP